MPLDVNRLRKPFRKLRKDLKGFPKQPIPELVHEMRTSSRRIEAMLAALGLESPRPLPLPIGFGPVAEA